MPSVSLSPIFNGWQGFTPSGTPLALGLINTYQAGTNTPALTYTTTSGSTPNPNPIALDSGGRPPQEIWLDDSIAYKFVLVDSVGNILGTYDNIVGIGTDANNVNTQIRADLANSASATKGAGMVGYNSTVAYGPNTVGAAIKSIQSIDVDALNTYAANLSTGVAVTIACFGDSTMWGADPANLNNQVALPPPTAFQNFVNNYIGNAALTVTNNAISGTTCTQMIAGTDGSGSTFAAKMAISNAQVVFCNHGINDAFGANATTVGAYKTALLQFIDICRSNGKTPVLVTPFPALTIGSFGSQDRAESTARFAQEMRNVASDHGATLIDNNHIFQTILTMDGQLPLGIFPDGVHATQAGYGISGNQFAAALLSAQCGTLNVPEQKLPASSSMAKATNQTISTSGTSRVGVVVSSGTASPQSLRVVFMVGQPGMDLILGGCVFSNGSANVAANLDGIALGNVSQLHAGFITNFWQDFETVISRNLYPGIHLLQLTTSSVGGAALNYLKSRKTEKPLLLSANATAPSERELLSKKLELVSSSAGALFIAEDMPASSFIDGVSIEWTSQMLKLSGVVIGGYIGSSAGPAVVERAISVILDSSGFVAVQEATSPGAYTTTVLGAVDLSVASHLYRLNVTNAGVVTVFVDGAQVGGTVSVSTAFKGGWIGLLKATAGGTLTVTDISRVWGQ